MTEIYLDYAATTPTSSDVLAQMLPFFAEEFGNGSSIHRFGRRAKKHIGLAREKIQWAIQAKKPDEVIFTSGGTESDHMAICGVASRLSTKGQHIITSQIEHHAVLRTCQQLEKQGWRITYLPVDGEGKVNPSDVEQAISSDTVLISIMMANNETGVLQPIADMGSIAQQHGVYFHTDAVQAAGVIPIDVDALHVDLLSMTAHKMYGPQGIGALYIRSGTRIMPGLLGGEQERGRRAGTENLPGIVGFGAAVERAVQERAKQCRDLERLRNRLADGVLATIPHIRINGTMKDRLPNNLNLCFEGVDGEALLMQLDMQGVAVSSGSACSSGDAEVSHVLKAMGLSHEDAQASLRFSLGAGTTQNEIDTVLNLLPNLVKRLRAC